MLKELDDSGKHVLITEHAYAPEYDRSHDSGRFCVQFLTFDRSQAAGEVMRWWQERCLEWCFARYEDGKFGDQVYLDQWPALFGDRVQIVRQVENTLAPWNVRYFAKDVSPEPVMYHFHNLRLLPGRRVRLFKFYNVGRAGLTIYSRYLDALAQSFSLLDKVGIEVPTHVLPGERFGWLKGLAALAGNRAIRGHSAVALTQKRRTEPRFATSRAARYNTESQTSRVFYRNRAKSCPRRSVNSKRPITAVAPPAPRPAASSGGSSAPENRDGLRRSSCACSHPEFERLAI